MDWKPIKPPFWLSAGELQKYTRFLNRWYQQVKAWIAWPMDQIEVDTASLAIVDLLAWQRDIERFEGEPEWLYRKRVKFAEQNVLDAGSTAGLHAIWQRMGLGPLVIEERLEDRDWDVIRLTITELTLSQYPKLVDVVLKSYAITCRRYELTSFAVTSVAVRPNHFSNESQNLTARI